jgi:hypothetical protein
MAANPKRWSRKKMRDLAPAGETIVGFKSNSTGDKSKAA